MAHRRERFLSLKLAKLLSQSPSVCLLGMRQTGKTTLLSSFSRSYFTLDDSMTLARFRDGDWSALENASTPVGIDECQKLPSLFDRVKLMIDRKKQVGRFILTGSVRFLSKRQIQESLTGRSLLLELLPMTLAESHEKPQRNIIAAFCARKGFPSFAEKWERGNWATPSMVDHHLDVGGLPGICYKRESDLRTSLHEQHLETLLSRDLPMLHASRVPIPSIRELLRMVALNQGRKLSALSLARNIRVSVPTVQALLTALEGLFIVRSVDGRHYLEDQGMANFLVARDQQPMSSVYESFVFRELSALIRYRYFGNAEIHGYSTRGGIDLPFVITLSGKAVLAISVDHGERATEKSVKSLGLFAKRNPGCKVLALFRGRAPYVASNGVACLPLHWLV